MVVISLRCAIQRSYSWQMARGEEIPAEKVNHSPSRSCAFTVTFWGRMTSRIRRGGKDSLPLPSAPLAGENFRLMHSMQAISDITQKTRRSTPTCTPAMPTHPDSYIVSPYRQQLRPPLNFFDRAPHLAEIDSFSVQFFACHRFPYITAKGKNPLRKMTHDCRRARTQSDES